MTSSMCNYTPACYSLTSYNCCVSAVYELYRAEGVCDEIETPELFISATTTANSDHNLDAKIVGVLGFIVVILLIMLMISGNIWHTDSSYGL